ncbi:MAG: hemolysin family protein [Buchananella hordeovulneris]|nr:hemolysin family protein [Buchananella hordeovulneris]
MNTTTALIIGLVLLALNAFFVAAEFAILSARRSRIEPLVDEGRRGAKDVLHSMEHVSMVLAFAQLGVTVCSTGLGVIAEPALAHLLETPLRALGLGAGAAHLVAVVIAVSLVVYLHVVLGEMVPKNLAVANPEGAALVMAPVIRRAVAVLHPVLHLLDNSANAMLRAMKVEPKSEVASAFTVEEVATIVEHSQAQGVLVDEGGLLSGAIEFSDHTARDVMVPPESLVTLPAGASAADVEAAVAQTGFSRYPLERDGQFEGYVHIKDAIAVPAAMRAEPVPAWRLRRIAAVQADDEVETALRAMQASGSHLACVMDGEELVGMVFLEDILEELVGEVRDSMQRGKQP